MTSPPFKVRALYDYVSQEEDDLNFGSNQIITVTDVEDADWYYGEFEDETASKVEGLFPKNFVKLLEPEAPPRPTRSNRNKRESDSVELNSQAQSTGAIAQDSEQAAPKPQPSSFTLEAPDVKPSQTMSSKVDQPMTSEEPREPAPTPAQNLTPAKPVPPVLEPKPEAPLGGEKSSANAFRDRINAFNKSAAPPVAPVKPTGLTGTGTSGFVKKPFVAPPPSKNAYIPPPREVPPLRTFRREENMDAPVQAEEEDKAVPQGDAPSETLPVEEDEHPKPTSLKDRIALLQKQQIEQAARHADAAQKKEKARRARKVTETDDVAPNLEDEDNSGLAKVVSGDSETTRSVEAPKRRRPSRNETAASLTDSPHLREVMSDGNDADQSGAGDTEDGDEASTERDDSDSKSKGPLSGSVPRAIQREPQKPDAEGVAELSEEEEKDEDEDDIDPEVRRRMEIRERMAKMSGGMGMAGMFGPSTALPPKAPSKKIQNPNERRSSGFSAPSGDLDTSKSVPVSAMVMPGMQNVSSPDAYQPLGVEDQAPIDQNANAIGTQNEVNASDTQVRRNESHASRRSVERPPPPPIPKDRPGASKPPESLIAGEQTSSHSLPNVARAIPPLPPPRQLMSPSEGSESDDELSSHDQRALGEGDLLRSSRDEPPLAASRNSRPQRIPSDSFRTSVQEPSVSSSVTKRTSTGPDDTKFSTAGPALHAPQHRAPPPPPPINAPSRRSLTGDKGMSPDEKRRQDQDDEEITEYEGDYDTDIASGAAHKDALKSHARASSQEDASITGETPLPNVTQVSREPASPEPPRAVPPPPPSLPQRSKPQPDVPRAAPPPPPSFEQNEDEIDEYDPYRYHSPVHGIPSSSKENAPPFTDPATEEPDQVYTSPTPQHRRMPSAAQQQSSPSAPKNLSAQSHTDHRQSSEMHRTSTTVRRSGDTTRPSGEHFIASDIDLSLGGWWAQPNLPPTPFQDRRDVIFEIDESSTSRRGGKKTVSKEVYVLFMDYSQTQISVQFEATEPYVATKLEQKHEPPPRSPRQDQLEAAHEKYGPQLANTAKSKENVTIGDGSPQALPYELISAIPDALPPVGPRAWGALIYTNFANATIQQYDEIRQGDLATFRNARFGGHRGPMKTKYSIEVGKPDHVGIVVDWDGSKKKLRVWEQGRESKKVKVESFKLGDMKSGEVKVWRVMSRAWVGWEGNN